MATAYPKLETRSRETRVLQATELRVKRNADGMPEGITGYAAMFNSLSEPMSTEQEAEAGTRKVRFREMIAPGAFAESLTGGADVRALYNHDPNYVLGRVGNGTLTLTEDEKGLRFDVVLNPKDPEAMSVAAKVERKDVAGCSFGFRVQQEDWKQENGENIRTVQKCALFDVGPVTYPAYTATSVDVRSIAQAVSRLTGEKRVMQEVEYDDGSLRWACGCAVRRCRDLKDQLQVVIDYTRGVEAGAITPADLDYLNDLAGELVDIVPKVRQCRGLVEGLGGRDVDDDGSPAGGASGTESASAGSDTQDGAGVGTEQPKDDGAMEGTPERASGDDGPVDADDPSARMAKYQLIQRRAMAGLSVRELWGGLGIKVTR